LTGGGVLSSGVLGPDGTLYIASGDSRVSRVRRDVCDATSPAGAETCDPCVPNVFSLRTFSCFSVIAQVGVIGGYIISVFSALFCMYKFRLMVLE
jgi:hypothetical protein